MVRDLKIRSLLFVWLILFVMALEPFAAKASQIGFRPLDGEGFLTNEGRFYPDTGDYACLKPADGDTTVAIDGCSASHGDDNGNVFHRIPSPFSVGDFVVGQHETYLPVMLVDMVDSMVYIPAGEFQMG